MKLSPTLRMLIPLWLGWFLLLYGFQALTQARFEFVRPDRAVPWAEFETKADSNKGKIYLLEPFMNAQVAWDSEYYIGIAVGGYDDPAAGKVSTQASQTPVIKNYSFFPFYPALMAVLKYPFYLFGLNPIAAATAAGALISLLGTLAGMVALYELTRGLLDDSGAYRAAFYMLIFPTAFFFAMIYTEGTFVGLAFWSLLLAKRRHWLWAGVLAALAAFTRAHGAALALPLFMLWWQQTDPANRLASLRAGRGWLPVVAAFMPLAAYAIWRVSPLGQGWALLQPGYFSRGLLNLKGTLDSINYIFPHAFTVSSAGVTLGIELFTVLLTAAAALWLWRRDAALAAFSLAVVFLSVLSGSFQSLARYMLIAPALYIFLAHLGQNKTFDRLWTMASVLLMGMLAALFAVDFWVG
ncbi:MAG: hypothetical protein WHV44_08480 [Anaerolineales bacterium]